MGPMGNTTTTTPTNLPPVLFDLPRDPNSAALSAQLLPEPALGSLNASTARDAALRGFRGTPAQGNGYMAFAGADNSGPSTPAPDIATTTTAPKTQPDLATRKQNARTAYESFKKAGENVDGYNATSAAHDKKNPGSDHRKGLAFDWHVKGADNLARAMAIPGVRYVIHDRKIYFAKDGFKPHPYVGNFANGQAKDPHSNHIHINF